MTERRRFAAEVDFTVINGAVNFINGKVVSSVYGLQGYMTNVEYDIFNPNIVGAELAEKLPNGHYFGFMFGEMKSEEVSDETSRDVSFIFIAEDNDTELYILEYDMIVNRFTQRRYIPEDEEDDDNVRDGG